jgi:predicted nucleic acid-binding protein
MERLRSDYPEHKCVRWAEALTESANLFFPTERARGETPDPGDEKVLECALAADAEKIVTGDKKHLLPLRSFRGIAIVSPAAFLRALGPIKHPD